MSFGNKGGQPTKYRPEHCQTIEDELAKGYSVTASAATLNVHLDTVYEWKKVYPEFSEAIKRGQAKSLQFFENALMGKVNGTNRKADTSCLIFALKTRFHKTWGEKQKIEQETTHKIQSIEELIETSEKES